MSGHPAVPLDPRDSLSAYERSKATAALVAIRIVHLADLHFVTHPLLKRLGFGYKGLSGHDSDTQEALETEVQRLKPDLLFATGDHTTWGDKRSLLAARAFLVQLGKRIGLTEERTFWVPGNHDILLHYYLGIRWIGRNYDRVFGRNQAVRLLDVAGFKVAVFSFDSTLDRKGEWSPLWPLVGSRGRISRQSFNEFNAAVQNTQGLEATFKIAQLHHHPLPIPYKGQGSAGLELTTMTNGGTFIAYMQESGVNLILHGHEHYPYSCQYCFDPTRENITVVAGGTACQERTQTNSFNYLEVVPRVSVVIRQYDYSEVGFRIGAAKVFRLQQLPATQ